MWGILECVASACLHVNLGSGGASGVLSVASAIVTHWYCDITSHVTRAKSARGVGGCWPRDLSSPTAATTRRLQSTRCTADVLMDHNFEPHPQAMAEVAIPDDDA